jgi:hypothetical protein
VPPHQQALSIGMRHQPGVLRWELEQALQLQAFHQPPLIMSMELKMDVPPPQEQQ